jgi:predicted RNA methylase
VCCPGEIVARCEWVVDHGAVDASGESRLQAALRVFHHQAFVRAGAQLAQRQQIRLRIGLGRSIVLPREYKIHMPQQRSVSVDQFKVRAR